MIYVLCNCDPAAGCLLFVGVVGSCRVALALLLNIADRFPHRNLNVSRINKVLGT